MCWILSFVFHISLFRFLLRGQSENAVFFLFLFSLMIFLYFRWRCLCFSRQYRFVLRVFFICLFCFVFGVEFFLFFSSLFFFVIFFLLHFFGLSRYLWLSSVWPLGLKSTTSWWHICAMGFQGTWLYFLIFLWNILFRVVSWHGICYRYTVKISVLKSWCGCAEGVSQGRILGPKAPNVILCFLHRLGPYLGHGTKCDPIASHFRIVRLSILSVPTLCLKDSQTRNDTIHLEPLLTVGVIRCNKDAWVLATQKQEELSFND